MSGIDSQAHPYRQFLSQVHKPGRYLGGEEQQICKPLTEDLSCRFVLAFPDLYEVGMSHLGTRILYDLINREPDLACERAFSPWKDMEEQLRKHNLPLVSLESYTPLREFDVVGVSLQYELSYSNVLLNLDLGGIPLRSEQRSDADPIVLAGGPTATHPEPLAPFIDLFLEGEAEEILPSLLRLIGTQRRQGQSRAAILAAAAQLPGIYVPAFYQVARDPRSDLLVVSGLSEAGKQANAPRPIQRVWVRDLDQFPFPTSFPVPYAEAIFDRAAVEITRGCTEGCRFCQAGMIYRPVRERKPKDIVQAVLAGVDQAGFTETSLTALSTADVSCIDPLIKELVPELRKRKVKLGVASLRAYGLNEELLDEIKGVGINGLTFAPEAGTQRMRDVINKNVSDEDILLSARRMFERGYERIKMYFIIGLPTETDEDVAGIIETGRKVRELAKSMGLQRMPTITCSVSQHVPKPHTPFQWAAMDNLPELITKVEQLRSQAKRARVNLKTHSPRESWLECLFARGDREMADVLERAYHAGARFDGWREYFSFDRWLTALAETGVDAQRYTRTLPLDGRLPWDHIDIGFEPEFLADEYRKALKHRVSPPCGKPFGAKVHHTTLQSATEDSRRLVCYDCGIACDMSEMGNQRIDALQQLQILHEKRNQEISNADSLPAEGALPLIPSDQLLSKLKGKLNPSQLRADHAFKANAEAPFSRLRLFFSKTGRLRFMGHLDLLRMFPRLLRRAGLEMAFTRGFNPVPRMSFTPALALGIAALEEAVDLDVLLANSAEDMAGLWTADIRQKTATDLLARLQQVCPEGLTVLSSRLLEPGEVPLGALVTGADYRVELTVHQAQVFAETVHERLGQQDLWIERTHKNQHKRINARLYIEHARVDIIACTLEFRLRMDSQGSIRPREAIWALTGEEVGDHLVSRVRLLTRNEAGHPCSLAQLGAKFRSKQVSASKNIESTHQNTSM